MKLKECDIQTIKGVGCFFLFIFFMLFKYLPFQIIGIDINNIPVLVNAIYTIVIELIIILIIINVYKDYILKSFDDFKKNKYKYFKKYLKYWFVILVGTIILNSIIMLLNKGQIANNEETVRSLLSDMPLYTWIVSVLLAPFLEELIFRLSLKSVFKNKWIFIIMSGLIFGSFHIFGNASTWLDILYIFPYSLPGCVFAYVLWESDNIFNTIGLHFLHNGMVMSLQIFLLIFGANII